MDDPNANITTSGIVKCTPQNPDSGLNTAEGFMSACEAGTLQVTMGMFFDGTGNNRFNTDTKPRNPTEDSVSYKNFYSNVAKMWKYYIGSLDGAKLTGNGENGENFNIYIEGIGTSNGNDDNDFGLGLAFGQTGIRPRVRAASFEVIDSIKQKTSLDTIDIIEITFDVFGFSRGAAAARHFIDRNSMDPFSYIRGDFKKPTNDPSIPVYNSLIEFYLNHNQDRFIEVNIKWRFAGLYETVSSYGFNQSNDITQLGLMNIDHVEKIVHIRAKDEYRENFAFTPTTSNNTDVIQLLGVHSDIGGGYSLPKPSIKGEEYSEYKKILYKSKTFSRPAVQFNEPIPSPTEVRELDRIEEIQDRFIKEGWYRKNQEVIKKDPNSINDIKIIDKFLYSTPSSNVYEFQIIATRERVETTYSHIPLRLMTERAISAGVFFNDQIKTEYQLDQTLTKVYDKFNTLFINLHNWDPLLKELRYKYLHWSSSYNAVESTWDFLPSVRYPNTPSLYNNWFVRRTIN